MRPVVGGLQQSWPGRFEFKRFDFDLAADRQAAISQYGLPVHPAFALIDRHGVLVERIIGAVPAEVLEQKITALIEADAPDP